jgi:hypothetical protein
MLLPAGGGIYAGKSPILILFGVLLSFSQITLLRLLLPTLSWRSYHVSLNWLLLSHRVLDDSNDNQEDGPANPAATDVGAPYLIPVWTRFDRSTRIATLYYTVSTGHPPYNALLMKAQVHFGRSADQL